MTKYPNHIYMIIFDREKARNVLVEKVSAKMFKVRVSAKMFKVRKGPQEAHGILSVSAEDAHVVRCWGFRLKTSLRRQQWRSIVSAKLTTVLLKRL